MGATVIDTLRFANRLKAAGVQDGQAEAMSRAFNDELAGGVASKDDLERAVAELKAEITKVDAKVGAGDPRPVRLPRAGVDRCPRALQRGRAPRRGQGSRLAQRERHRARCARAGSAPDRRALGGSRRPRNSRRTGRTHRDSPATSPVVHSPSAHEEPMSYSAAGRQPTYIGKSARHSGIFVAVQGQESWTPP